MDNYFNTELELTVRELTDLKTAAQKSAVAAPVVTKFVNVSVNLQYEDISYPWGSARARAIYKVVTDGNAIIIPTLDWYYGDISKAADVEQSTRQIRMEQLVLTDGSIGVDLYFSGTENGANSDAQRVKNGETITVSCTLTVRCTNDFEMVRV